MKGNQHKKMIDFLSYVNLEFCIQKKISFRNEEKINVCSGKEKLGESPTRSSAQEESLNFFRLKECMTVLLRNENYCE